MNKTHWRNNRAKLLSNAPKDAKAMVVVGNGLISRNADTSYAFRQDSNVLYLSGIKRPGIALFVDVRAGAWYVVVPRISKVESIFDDSDRWDDVAASAGLDGVLNEAEALQRISVLSKQGEVYINSAPPKRAHSVYANPHRADWTAKLRRRGIALKDVRSILASLRMFKQPYEIAAIGEAVAETKVILDGITKDLSNIQNASEKRIANRITAAMYSKGLEHAYQPIIASGHNAAVLHHQPDDAVIANNEVLLFDVGAEYCGYAADISRTIIVGENAWQKQLIADVTDAQRAIIQNIKPGQSWKELHQQAEAMLEVVAKKHNLLENATVKELFPHAIGHFLGLDVHDAGDYTQPLQENMVITIEPGLYSKQRKFGVRIEDDILITKTGAKIL